MYLSIGEELESEGETLTSKSHGLKSLSIRISNPYISKHVYLVLTPPILVTIGFSTDNIVLIITSFILSNVASKSAPSFSYSFLS